MIALVLPIFWAIGTPTALGLLSSIARALGLLGLAADNAKLQRMADLGLDPEVWKTFEQDPTRELINSLKREPAIFELPEDIVQAYPDLGGVFFLIGTEKELFLDGLRHMCLRDGIGEEAERLKELIKSTNISYSDLSFLWEEPWSFDIAHFRSLSDKRLSDPEMGKMVNLG